MGERAKGNSIKEKTSIEAPADNRIRVLSQGAPYTISPLSSLYAKHARKWGYKVDTPVQKGFNARRCPDSSVGRAGIENPRVGGSIPSLGTNYSSLVQSVERRTVNPYVTGSSPVGGAKFERPAQMSGPFASVIYSHAGASSGFRPHAIRVRPSRHGRLRGRGRPHGGGRSADPVAAGANSSSGSCQPVPRQRSILQPGDLWPNEPGLFTTVHDRLPVWIRS